ncbi:glycoside hydrolase family 32 protein [Cutibacterium sp. V947]|uniref:glycoside hydrolase family 32 protein n=1 Tax=unclassified Cutibacterium TaxID=2649671 RepID=UPI003EE29E7F
MSLAFPRNHVRPNKGWMNDPNGVSYVDGEWHVFFQYNPYSARHDRVCWGHWSTRDLVSWHEHDLALVPRAGCLDAGGCWSGSFVMDGEMPTLLYTAVPEHANEAVAVTATGSPDMEVWVPRNRYSAPATGDDVEETRDPFPFILGGHRYVIQGSGRPGPDGYGKVLVYEADDLEHWKMLGTFLDARDSVASRVAPANIWECPNLLHIGGEWVLLVSLWVWEGGKGNLSGVRWMVGDLAQTDDGPRFLPADGGILDTGPAFYAPQAHQAHGRTLLWGWSWELLDDNAVDAQGWAGTLTTPRELTLVSGRLCQTPIKEYVREHCRELDTSWNAAACPSFVVNAKESAVVSCSSVCGDVRTMRVPAGGSLLVDGSLVELFHGGRSCTTRIYPEEGSEWSVTSDDAQALSRV